ncbi:MAG: histidine kinase [Acidimicrobiia bacterium]|nr:histidine kinase [Acidimicrobiia bacterium]MDX2467586.1 histidine kinase [Acidimicrobiia bacterium]
MINALRSLWAEPREPNPPRRVWRDWVLVGMLVGLALLEGITREELVWRPLSVPMHLLPIVMLLWRRTHPLLSVAIAWSVITGLDIAAIAVGRDSPGLHTMVGMIVFPYALFRWGSGRDAVIGLIIMNVMHVTNMIWFPSGPELTIFSFAWLLLPSSLGAAVRFRNRAQVRAIAEAKLFEREQLARELHDTVAHHVSAIAIQAEAGWALSGSDPEASVRALRTIKTEASRTLTEMRSIIGVLRRGEDEHSPQKRLSDLERLASNGAQRLPIELETCGDLDDVAPSIQTAVFRIAQEATTNARRHARRATGITIRVEGDGQDVVVTVTDDGDASYFDPKSPSGYGLVGMSERASLHGGSLDAGPNRGRGWTVKAVLPKQGWQG